MYLIGFPVGSDGEESACNAKDPGSIPGLGRSPGERNDNPVQYSCLENSMDRAAWQATIHGVAKSQTGLSNNTFTFTNIMTSKYIKQRKTEPRGKKIKIFKSLSVTSE